MYTRLKGKTQANRKEVSIAIRIAAGLTDRYRIWARTYKVAPRPAKMPKWEKAYIASAFVLTVIMSVVTLADPPVTIIGWIFLALAVVLFFFTMPVGLVPMIFVFGSTLANSSSHDNLLEKAKFFIIYPMLPLVINAVIYIRPLRQYVHEQMFGPKDPNSKPR